MVEDLSVSGAVEVVSAAVDKLQKEASEALKQWGQVGSAAADRTERTVNQSIQNKAPSAVPVEWLMAINIATKDFGKGDNIQRRLDQLRDLADKTKDKPVAITVQVAHSDLQNQNSTAASVYKFFVPKPYHVDRYVIHDGKMNKVESGNSQGYAGDVKELLSFSAKHFKPNKSAVLFDSHGSGNAGLSGDIGHTTLPEFTKGVDEGWPKANGKIDVLDFDSCLMAQEGVLKALRPLASHVVASAETERALGQDLPKTVNTLIEHPELTPAEYAEAVVELARLQPMPKPKKEVRIKNFYDLLESFKIEKGPDVPDRIQVRTLAHFSLANYQHFRSRLDDYGDALADAIKDPKNRQTIDRMIENAPSYGDWFGEAGECKDIKSFVDSMFMAIDKGKLSDPDGRLRITGGRVLDAHKKLVVSYSGFDGFGARGGLSDFLPERYSLDFHNRARTWIATGDYSRACNNLDLLASDRAKYIESIEKQLTTVDTELKKQQDKASDSEWDEATSAYKSAQAAIKQFRDAGDTKSTLQAVAQLKKTAADLADTRIFQERLAEEERKRKKDIDEKYTEHLVDPKTGWGRFRQELRRLD